MPEEAKKLTNTQLEIKREAKNFLPYHLIICCFFAFSQSFLQLSQNVYLCNTTTPNASLTQGTTVDKTVPKAPIQAGSCKTGRSMWICLGSAEWAPYFYSSLVGYLISTLRLHYSLKNFIYLSSMNGKKLEYCWTEFWDNWLLALILMLLQNGT